MRSGKTQEMQESLEEVARDKAAVGPCRSQQGICLPSEAVRSTGSFKQGLTTSDVNVG